MKQPDKVMYNDDDDRNLYAEILRVTNAVRQRGNPNKPKSSASVQYKEIIKPIWEEQIHGKGVGGEVPVIVISEDPNVLARDLDLRMNSFDAGNTGVRNEIVAISDELLRQGVLIKD